MFDEAIPRNQYLPWMTAALLVPLTHAAAGMSWLAALILGGASIAALWGVEVLKTTDAGEIRRGIQNAWVIFALAAMMHWSGELWHWYRYAGIMPLTVLLVAVWAAEKGSQTGARAGNVLHFFTVAMLATVILTAIRDIEIKNAAPTIYIKNADLITAVLISVSLLNPAAKKASLRSKGAMLLYIVAIALITSGVLSTRVIAQEKEPFFELSRSIVLSQSTKRLESLAAAAFTIGYFITFNYLLCASGRKGEESQKGRIQLIGIIAAVVYIMNIQPDSIILAVFGIIVWMVLPVAAKIIN